MNKNDLKQLFARTEEKFLKCWKILEPMKEFKIDSDEFPSFQPLLCDALLQLSNAYKKVHQSRQVLIDNKERYSPSFFARRQKLLADRQKAILETMAIGRSLGDAFAWFFYQNDIDYLKEHAKHEFSPHMPPGFGGIGEREFLANIKSLNGFMVLYHGTTNILRIGDVSLINLKKFKVEAIGELKTTPLEPGKLNISLHIISSGNIHDIFNGFHVSESTSSKKKDEFPQSMKNRLARQIKRMSEMIANSKKNKNVGKVDKEERRHVKDFESLYNDAKIGEFAYKQLGDGLLCAIYRSKKRTLYSKQFNKKKIDFGSKMQGITEHAQKLILDGSCHNQIIFGTLLYSSQANSNVLLGAIPLFWWPLKSKYVRELMFQDSIAVNIYNPAHLISLLEANGFSVNPVKEKCDFILKLRHQSGEIEIGGMSYFMRLIAHDMFYEKQIVEILVETVDNIKSRGLKHSGHIEIQFAHRFRM